MAAGMRKTQRPTMKDVARLAGVSIQTVSVVVNDTATISPETRERIQAAIDELGYRPLAVARSLRTGSTRTIALVVSDITNPFFSRMASLVEDYAHQAGYTLILYNTHSDLEREASYLQMAAQRWVDGVLFVATRNTFGGLEPLRAAGIPVVAVDRIPDGYDGPWVILDNRRTGELVAEHLLDLGHRHVAHISGPLDLRLSDERLEGFSAAVEDGGAALVARAAGDDSWSCASGHDAMWSILEARPRPTAVFASNDRLAIGAMRAAAEAGLRIPDDISIVGVDDIEFAAYQSPPLTTVRQSLADVATLGTKILIDLLRGEPADRPQVVFKPELVVRQSTANPPGSPATVAKEVSRSKS
jgi:LacI family transcriptional regulator